MKDYTKYVITTKNKSKITIIQKNHLPAPTRIIDILPCLKTWEDVKLNPRFLYLSYSLGVPKRSPCPAYISE